MAAPKVSVCIPTYNYAAFLPETVESILGQNFSDFELVIIDDNSTDGTRGLIESYAQKDPRIRFSVNACNVGMVENWNGCLAGARGEYVKFVFGDDLLASPDALGQMVALLDGDQAISLVCSARNVIDEKSRFLRVESPMGKSCVLFGFELINSCLVQKKNLIGEPSVVMFRRAQAGRGFLPNYRQIVDLEMWFHLLEQGSCAFIEQPLCSFRIHGQQQTVKNEENVADLFDFCYLAGDYLDKDYLTLPSLMKQYIRYDGFFGIWKLYLRGKIDEDTACELIETHYGFAKFKSWLPAYKLFKPWVKMYRKVRG
jgi:glycosyltransferase involved in cell wall biosynthesis